MGTLTLFLIVLCVFLVADNLSLRLKLYKHHCNDYMQGDGRCFICGNKV